jgi:hypothetical protein
MKHQDVKYEILCEIEGENPHIQIGFRFKDYFETNTYYLISESAGYPAHSNMAFDIVKDGKEIGKVYLKENDVRKLLNDFLAETKDHDFKKIVLSKYERTVEQDVFNFFEHYRKSVIENKNSLSGELKRMRSVAGII